MTKGAITKLVSSFGASWGRILTNDGREIFFNARSLANPDDFLMLNVGQEIEFEECADPVNGIRAENITLTAIQPAGI